MGGVVIKVGMIGYNEGNGHPFSFSAIINGFDAQRFAGAGWPVIHDYLSKRDAADFGMADLRVTHAWTPFADVTRRLCDACDIPNAAGQLSEVVGGVDAAIIARDDAESHWELAAPFLERGIPVFVDKPLAASRDDLERFLPYLRRGKLMSCSAMRYATELDDVRARLATYGELKLARAAVVNDWMRYGIHAVDAIFGAIRALPRAVSAPRAAHESLAIETRDGPLVLVDALGAVGKLFNFDFIGTERSSSHQVNDNFSMFRRLLWHFATMVRTGEPPISPAQALAPLRILLAGQEALRTRTRIEIADAELQ